MWDFQRLWGPKQSSSSYWTCLLGSRVIFSPLREDAMLGATGILLSQQKKWQLLTRTARPAMDKALPGVMWGWGLHCDPGLEEVCSQGRGAAPPPPPQWSSSPHPAEDPGPGSITQGITLSLRAPSITWGTARGMIALGPTQSVCACGDYAERSLGCRSSFLLYHSPFAAAVPVPEPLLGHCMPLEQVLLGWILPGLWQGGHEASGCCSLQFVH